MSAQLVWAVQRSAVTTGNRGGYKEGHILLWDNTMLRSCAAILLSALLPLAAVEVGYVERTMTWDGMARRYTVYVPAAIAAEPSVVRPLVLVIHGGYGGSDSMRAVINNTPNTVPLESLADSAGWIVVYPNGSDGSDGTAASGNHWNDDRPVFVSGSTELEHVDDVGFLLAVADACAAEWNADAQRIHLAGMSNGAYMSLALARSAPHRLAAIAPVTGAIIATNSNGLTLASYSQGVPAIFINGVADPIIPYAGGGATYDSIFYTIYPAEDGVAGWAQLSGSAPLTSQALPNTDPTDGCTVRLDRHAQPADGSGHAVHFYSITGGGHTWPDSVQNLPISIVGQTCRDFSGNAAIWDFFAHHGRVTSPTVEVAAADRRPLWSWTPGGATGGAGIFRHAFSEDAITAAAETTALTFQPASDLADGTHRLWVQERNAAGTWSALSSAAITISGPGDDGGEGDGGSDGGAPPAEGGDAGSGCGAGSAFGLIAVLLGLLSCARSGWRPADSRHASMSKS